MRRIIALPDPKANNVVVRNHGAGRLVSLRMDLTTDATVGNRLFVVAIVDKVGAEKIRLPPPQVIAAASVVVYSLGVGLPLNYGPGIMVCSLPYDFSLDDDDELRVFDSSAVSAGDQVTNLVMVMELES